MKKEQIVIGGYYAIADYSKKIDRVYKVKDIKIHPHYEHVYYDYYDGERRRLGSGKTSLNDFAASMSCRVKPKRHLSGLEKYITERKWK